MEKMFKTHLKDLFGKYRLSKEQLCRLEQLQAGDCVRRGSGHFLRTPWAMAAMAMLVLGAVWIGWQQYRTTMEVKQLMAEIVYNHNKQMAMEIESDTIEVVKSFLTKLDFPLIATDRLPPDQWQLLGGRYCSLQGKLAAQLKLRQVGSGDIYTLFQTVCPPGIAETGTLTSSYINGVEVQLWSERGLLLGMAGGH